MTLNNDEFNSAMSDFIQKSKLIQDDWEMKEFEGLQYMTKKSTIFDTLSSPLTVEYHVIYSQSYSVPVLYLRAYSTGGNLLKPEEFLNVINKEESNMCDNLLRDRGLMPMPHPYFQTPFHQLHPCKTAELMHHFKSDENSNYLVSWLSSIGPLMGIHLDFKYATIKNDTK